MTRRAEPAAARDAAPPTGSEPVGPRAQWYRRYGTAVPGGLDLSRPSSARVYDRLLGGKDNFAVDREVADRLIEIVPTVPEGARVIRACLRRVVRSMATEAGIDQFLDLGSGLPARENVHEVVQRYAPAGRTVYVDNDPVVVAHARAFLACDGATTAAATADLRDVDGVLGHPEVRRLIDLDRPVGLIISGVVHYVPGGDEVRRAIAAYRDRLAPGSHLFISSLRRLGHPLSPVGVEMKRILRESLGATLRPLEEIEAFFAGWELLEPGLVPLVVWRPDPHDGPGYDPGDVPDSFRAQVGGLARKRRPATAPAAP